MGTGTVGLLAYALCCGSAFFIVATGFGLFWWGERRKKRPEQPLDPP